MYKNNDNDDSRGYAGVRRLRHRSAASDQPEVAHQSDDVGPRSGAAVPAAAEHVGGGQGQDGPDLPEHGVRQLLSGVGDRGQGTVSARRLQTAAADRPVEERPHVHQTQAGRAGRARASLFHTADDRRHQTSLTMTDYYKYYHYYYY